MEAKVYLSDTDHLKDLSPVFVAVHLEQIDILEHICDIHPDINYLNSHKQTPIMVACYQKKLKSFDFLSLRCNHNLNIEDEDGISFLVH